MNDYVGNITTIIKVISMIIAGWALGIAVAHNLDLGVDAATLSELISSLILFFLAILDAKYPNSFKFLGNNKNPQEYPMGEVVLNEDYITEIGDDDDGI